MGETREGLAAASPPPASSAQAQAKPAVPVADDTRRGGWVLVLVGVVLVLLAVALVLLL